MAAVYASFAVLAWISAGNRIFQGGLSLWQLLAAELAAGIFGGLVLGLSLPWITSLVRSAIVGSVVGAISGLAVFITDKGFGGLTWAGSDIVIPYAALGLVIAVALWKRAARSSKDSRSRHIPSDVDARQQTKDWTDNP
jgi:hypothetical protein